jgi:hypothetical protein
MRCRACANSFAREKRWSGCLASARATTRSSSGEIERSYADGRRRLALDDALGDREGTALEGLLSREELVEHHARREDVRPVVDREALDLLRRHVRGRTHHGAGLRELDARALDVGEPRHAEVGELHAPLRVEHHVRRLDVAMDHARGVGEVQAVEELADHAQRLLQLEALLRFQHRLEVAAR